MENNCKATIDPLVIEMKNEQIEDLKDRLKRKEEELEKKTKEMKEELEKKDKEMKDAVATKDNELKAELARRETLVPINYTPSYCMIFISCLLFYLHSFKPKKMGLNKS